MVCLVDLETAMVPVLAWVLQVMMASLWMVIRISVLAGAERRGGVASLLLCLLSRTKVSFMVDFCQTCHGCSGHRAGGGDKTQL